MNLKYDSVHKEILAKFGSIMSSEMSDVFSVLSKSRGELETHSVETASTSEAVSFITHVQALKRKMRGWDKQVETFKAGQKVLERQRFQFPQGIEIPTFCCRKKSSQYVEVLLSNEV